MDLYRVSATDHLPNLLLERWSSLIWTERYQTPGDFELRSPDVNYYYSRLGKNSLITLGDSKEVMIVESINVIRNEQGTGEIIYKGRTLDSLTDQRIALVAYQKRYKMALPMTPADAITVILWNCFVNPTTTDVTRATDTWTKGTRTRIPGWGINDVSTTNAVSMRRWIGMDNITEPVQRLLKRNRLGLRTRRPPNAGMLREVITSGGMRGQIDLQPYQTNNPEMLLEIYSGLDRTADQTDRKPVIFRYDMGDLVTPEYLWDYSLDKTYVMVQSSVGWKQAYDPTGYSYNRKEMIYDAGSPEDDTTKSEFLEDLQELAEELLEQNTTRVMFTANVASTAQYQYGKDYFLGDRITLMGEFGVKERMRVDEFVRTQDLTGERGVPGLVAVKY